MSSITFVPAAGYSKQLFSKVAAAGGSSGVSPGNGLVIISYTIIIK